MNADNVPESNLAAAPLDAAATGDTLLDLRQAADFVGVSPGRLDRLRRSGEIPARRVGLFAWRFRQADLIAYVERDAGVRIEEAVSPPPERSTRDDIIKIITELGPDPDTDVGGVDPNEEPIVRLANAFLVAAIDQGASDIHIEPDRRNLRIRIRVDGEMEMLLLVPKSVTPKLIARYKVMADMSLDRSGDGQCGCIRIKHGELHYNIRVSSIPSLYGENLTLHILEQKSPFLGLNKLGFAPDSQVMLEQLVAVGRGLALLAGPPNSGRTTTAAAIINKLNSVNHHICTFEDVCEYQIGGILQTYRSPTRGISTATAIAALLGHDPNILFVGEIRDRETAQAAVDAAVAGVMTIATISAPDALNAIQNLIGFGVDRRQVARALTGVCAQHLVRQICTNCRVAEERPTHSIEQLEGFGFVPNDPNQLVPWYRGAGCTECREKGYRGRTGIFEVLSFSDELAALVAADAPDARLRESARGDCRLIPLKEDALKKALAGIMTFEEASRILRRTG